ncbi:MAG: thiolase family protein, partial [Bdellovibrionales bacterium]|nr:thiolase family protein [Bdellovibrionales bacterium]
RAVIKKSGAKAEDIDQVIVSNIGQASADSFFLPRHIGLYAGAPLEAPASLVQRICGSGIEVVGQAAEQVALGKGHLILGCGTDTMSRFPLVSFTARQGFQLGRPEYVDLLWEALNDTAAVPMGMTADNVAKKYSLTREEVDAFSLRSQERYAAAKAKNFFADEITAVETGDIEMAGYNKRKIKLNKAKEISEDEHPRQTSLDQLAKLPFVFSKEGPTTAGTASGIVDGACAVLVASDEYCKKSGLKPLGRILGVCASGIDPNVMGLGPVPAIKALLQQLNLNISQIDLFEINEAFGAQCLGVARALELDESKLNVHGGAIAIGHPLGATGQRLVTTLLKGLKARGGKLGVASACIGGGQGIAMVVEAL